MYGPQRNYHQGEGSSFLTNYHWQHVGIGLQAEEWIKRTSNIQKFNSKLHLIWKGRQQIKSTSQMKFIVNQTF